MNMLPHCVQTSVVDLGPRCSGLSFRKKPACMCRRECSSKVYGGKRQRWQQEAAEVMELSYQGWPVPTGRHLSLSVGQRRQWSRGDAVVLPASEARALGCYFWCLAERPHSHSQQLPPPSQAALTDIVRTSTLQHDYLAFCCVYFRPQRHHDRTGLAPSTHWLPPGNDSTTATRGWSCWTTLVSLIK